MYSLSINITYYNEPHFLKWWYNTIVLLNMEGHSIMLNIADDGSLRKPAIDFFNDKKKYEFIRLFRVPKDIGFNSHGCRNLMMKQTVTDWNLLSDIDRSYPEETLIAMTDPDKRKRGEHYGFYHKKSNEYTLNEYLIHKDDFWLSGGYDEELVNVHWGDRLFFESALFPVCKRVNRRDLIISYDRGARDVSDGDVDTTQYPDDNTLINPKHFWWSKRELREKTIKFIKERNADPERRVSKPVVQFEWERVF